MSTANAPSAAAPALSVRGLRKRYPQGWLARPGPPAVDGVDLALQTGEVVGLIGESGSGKTTLARCALGLLPFGEGEVSVLGHRLPGRLPRALRSQAQLIFQDPDAMLNPGLSVRAHLLESARLHRQGEDPALVAAQAAEEVSLSHRLDALPAQLSGGERRRAGVARALLARPALLVADEPTSGLDAALKADLIDLLLRRRAARATLLVSHDLPLMAYACDRLVVMYAGRVVERFSTAGLGALEHHPYTRTLLRSAGLLPPSPRAPSLAEGRWGPGCAWAGACEIAQDGCTSTVPDLTTRQTPRGPQALACPPLLTTPEGSPRPPEPA